MPPLLLRPGPTRGAEMGGATLGPGPPPLVPPTTPLVRPRTHDAHRPGTHTLLALTRVEFLHQVLSSNLPQQVARDVQPLVVPGRRLGVLPGPLPHRTTLPTLSVAGLRAALHHDEYSHYSLPRLKGGGSRVGPESTPNTHLRIVHGVLQNV